MDLLHKALAREPLSAKELSKLYDYDIFTLGEAAQNIRAQLYDTKVFLIIIVILIQAIFAPMYANFVRSLPHAKIQIPTL